ncbi:MAG TPA: hypothetical protein VF707_18065 [Ardenticatenaceae bacterium]
MRHYVIFDGHCAACSSVATDIASSAYGTIELISIHSDEAKCLLDYALPQGWTFAPYFVSVNAEDVQAWTGAMAGLHLAAVIGFRRAFEIMQRHRLFITPNEIRVLPRFSSSRRLLLKGGAALWLASALPRVPGRSGWSPSVAEAAPNMLGKLGPQYPLGLSNVSASNIASFAQNILRLPYDGQQKFAPIYTQAIVHNTAQTQGPPGDASWCGSADSEANLGHKGVIRQVSAHDHQFGRRNITVGAYPLDAPNNSYISRHTQQIFYFYNEPEAGARPYKNVAAGCSPCNTFSPEFDPATQAPRIDPDAAGVESPFFWNATGTPYQSTDCVDTVATPKAIRASALGKLFLRYKARIEQKTDGVGNNRGHILLPPAAIRPELGAHPEPTGTTSAYWTTFYDYVHKNAGGASYPSVTVEQLRALHTHYYHWPPRDDAKTYNNGAWDAVRPTAQGIHDIRKGVEWYRSTYFTAGLPLPLDYILSEMGPDWIKKGGLRDQPYDADGVIWAAGFPNLRLGMAHWNTWLRWLTRNAEKDLNLATGQSVYAMAHTLDGSPFMYQLSSVGPGQLTATTRNQVYFNFDTYTRPTYVGCPVHEASGLGEGRATSAWNNWTYFGGKAHTTGDTYYFAPLGALYHVWSHIGGDPVTSTIGQGWFYDGATAGVKGDVVLDIPGSSTQPWSTVYIPIAKNHLNTESNFRYFFDWVKPDGTLHRTGGIDLASEFIPHPKSYSDLKVLPTDPDVFVPTAGMAPLLVYSTSPKPGVKLRITRESNPGYDNMGVSIGRPSVLGGVGCTWTPYQ